jgi:regulator of CtrA degradation
MSTLPANGQLTARLIDSLYVEAMVLADEVRAYFDLSGRSERDAMSPTDRVAFSCESLKVTTRLMHMIAWLLSRRAVEVGEISSVQAREPGRRLGKAADSDPSALARLPHGARTLIEASRDLYGRIERLDQEADRPSPDASPALNLQRRLARAF